MKKNIFWAICVFWVGVTAVGYAKETDRYKIETGSNYGSRSDMIRRIQHLEQEVRELKRHCYDSSYEPSDAQKTDKRWTCKVKNQTKFFYGEGYTKGSAQRQAMESCQALNNPLFCHEEECISEDLKRNNKDK